MPSLVVALGVAVRVVVLVLVVLGGVAAVGGAVFAGFRGVGAVAGGMLLGGPNVALAGLAAGAGVPWTSTVDGALADGLAGRVPAGTVDVPGLLTVVAVVVLLLAAVLAARRTPAHALGPASAAAMALVTGAVLTLVAWAAGGGVRAGLALFQMEMPVLDLALTGDPALALGIGLAAGGGAGAVAALLTRLLRRRAALSSKQLTGSAVKG